MNILISIAITAAFVAVVAVVIHKAFQFLEKVIEASPDADSDESYDQDKVMEELRCYMENR